MPGYDSGRMRESSQQEDYLNYLDGILSKNIEKYGKDSKEANNVRKQIDELLNSNLERTFDKYSKGTKTQIGKFFKDLKEAGHDVEKIFNVFLGAFNDISNSLKNNLDKNISNYIDSIEKLSYSLNGNLRNYQDVTTNLNRVLNGQNLVRQDQTFKNLTDIVTKGIVNNPEQKAFLQSLSQDLGMQFNVSNDTMRQLIRIQSEDSTANRMAIEYSLNEFLVQNYQTGEYIRQGFADVSRALLMSQSTMSSAMAASYEATVQTWMGTLYSNGVSQGTISQLAAAIDAVGSGNISGLGQGASNLVLMGAARAGLDYGELLNRGYQGNDVNRLMQGITSYIGEMGANSSNVVMSQLGNIFGLNIADIMAIRNNGVPNVAGMGASANANIMLNNITGLVPGVVRLMNGLSNFQYGWGARLASDPNALLNYEVLRTFVEPVGDLIGDISGLSENSKINTIGRAIGALIGNASLIPVLTSNWGQGGLKNIGSLFSGLYNADNGVNAFDIWKALGTGGDGINNTTVVTSSTGTSGSIGFSRNGGGGLLNNMRSSLADLGVEEVTGDEQTIDDHVINIDNNVGSVVDLLTTIRDSLAGTGGSSSPSITYGTRRDYLAIL